MGVRPSTGAWAAHLTYGYVLPASQAILLPSTDSHQLPIGPKLRMETWESLPHPCWWISCRNWAGNRSSWVWADLLMSQRQRLRDLFSTLLPLPSASPSATFLQHLVWGDWHPWLLYVWAARVIYSQRCERHRSLHQPWPTAKRSFFDWGWGLYPLV